MPRFRMPQHLNRVAICAVLIALSTTVSAELDVGDKAPEFALPGSDGNTHRLSDYRGQTVVVAWYPKAFTGG